MAEITRDQLVEDVAMRYGKYVTGSASTDSDDTAIEDTSNLFEQDDFWVGNYLGMTSGPADDEYRRIIDYDQYTAQVRVYPPFSADVATGSTESFEILPIQRPKIHQAINAAIVSAGSSWPKFVTDTSSITSISGGDYDYDLPSDLVKLLGVYTRAASDHAWIRIQPDYYEISGTPGAQDLEFNPSYILPIAQSVRLDYIARADTMSASSSTLGIGEPYQREVVDFITNYACYWLHDYQSSIANNEAEFSLHAAKAAAYREAAEVIRAQSGIDLTGRTREEE